MLFLLALELSSTHSIHNSPSRWVGSFLPIFLVLLILLQQTSAEDWVRMNEIPPSPSSMRLKDLASCFALGWTGLRAVTLWAWGPVCWTPSVCRDFSCSISINPHNYLRRKGLLLPPSRRANWGSERSRHLPKVTLWVTWQNQDWNKALHHHSLKVSVSDSLFRKETLSYIPFFSHQVVFDILLLRQHFYCSLFLPLPQL